MTLTFLGQSYESNTTELAAITSEQTGMYRGVPVKFSGTHAAAHANVTLTYRGARYSR